MNPKFLDPPPVGFEDFELDPARMADALATGWDAAGDGEDEAAQRVDLLLVLRLEKLDAELVVPACSTPLGVYRFTVTLPSLLLVALIVTCWFAFPANV